MKTRFLTATLTVLIVLLVPTSHASSQTNANVVCGYFQRSTDSSMVGAGEITLDFHPYGTNEVWPTHFVPDLDLNSTIPVYPTWVEIYDPVIGPNTGVLESISGYRVISSCEPSAPPTEAPVPTEPPTEPPIQIATSTPICGLVANDSQTGVLAPYLTVWGTNEIIDLGILDSSGLDEFMNAGIPGYFQIYDPVIDNGLLVNYSQAMKVESCEASAPATEPPEVPEEKTVRPVILVPGAFASYNSELVRKLPGSEHDESKWGWTGARAINVGSLFYSSLLKVFSDAGYSEDNEYFTVAFYDWRGPIPDSAKRLKQVIDEVKKNTGASSVDIIAHSMGGLVAREYITSDYYQKDVEHLVTMGSPFRGSVNAYYAVEGGELYGLPLISALIKSFFIEPFKCKFTTLNSSYPCWFSDVEIINHVAKGSYDVLPVDVDYYLYDSSTKKPKPLSKLKFQNRYLPESNKKNEKLLKLTKVLNIAGSGKRTLEGLNVKDFPCGDLIPDLKCEFLWRDGRPVERRESSNGDDTVLMKSALISGAGSFVLPVKHAGYMGNSEVQNEIFEFLGIRYPVGDYPSLYYASSLVVTVASPIDITVIDPQGRMLTPSQAQIPNSFYFSAGIDGPHAAVIFDPTAGDYSVRLSGNGDGEYHLIADYEVSDDQLHDPEMDYEFSGVIQSNAVVDISTRLDPAQADPLAITSMTPTIELPVYTGDTVVRGYATPGLSLEIGEQNGAILAGGPTNQDGSFSITLTNTLKRGQIIIAHSDGKASVPVIVQDNPRGAITPERNGAGVGILFLVLISGAVAIFVMQNRRQRIRASAPMARHTGHASLLVVSGIMSRESFELSDNFVIGRGSQCNLRLPGRTVSREHARIRYAQGRWFIQDMGSKSGTYVNDVKVEASALNNGDRIRISSTEFEFRTTR